MGNQDDADHQTSILQALSPARLAGYLEEVDGDFYRALELYEWNGRMAAACFVQIGHLEVLLRNALDKALAEYMEEDQRGIPWFLQRGLKLPESAERDIATARDRLLHDDRPDSRDRVVANLTFGFWSQLLGSKHDELWKKATRHAFQEGVTRKQVAQLAESVRKTRNRVAHHNYMKTFDVPRAMWDIFELARLVSSEFEAWMKSQSNWSEVYYDCPKTDVDTVVVAANVAWDIYQHHAIYVCRPGRYFREVDHLAFYENVSIRRQIPRILQIRDDVPWTLEEAERLSDSEEQLDRRLGKAMAWALSEEGLRVSEGWGYESYKVFILTSAREYPRGLDGHQLLPRDVPHRTSGRGSAFTQGQRYVSLHRLMAAETTEDIVVAPVG